MSAGLYAAASRIAVLRGEQDRLRSELHDFALDMDGFVRNCRDDKRCNLMPTDGSLARAAEKIERVLTLTRMP